MLRLRSSTVAAATSALFFSGLFECVNGKTWRCKGNTNYGDQAAADFAKCNNGYLSHASMTGHYAPNTGCRSDPDDFFSATQCVCYTFYSGCLCENDWFEDCDESESFSIIFYLQNCTWHPNLDPRTYLCFVSLFLLLTLSLIRSWHRYMHALLWGVGVLLAASDRSHDEGAREIRKPGAEDAQ